ncbi:MAG: DUF2341 domain-containing protein [bacterium]
METLTLTNFGGINTKIPEAELSTDPVESPNLNNVVMEQGMIFSRPPQDTHYDFGSGEIKTFFTGKIGTVNYELLQIGTVIKKKVSGLPEGQWWNPDWNKVRDITVTNSTTNNFTDCIFELILPTGFDYTNIKTNGEDLRFVLFEDSSWKVLSYFIKQWAKNVPQSSLTANIDGTVTSIPANTTGYPDSGVIKIENEKIWYGSKTDTQFQNCIRGYEETTAVAHSLNASIGMESYIRIKLSSINTQQTKIVQMYYNNANATGMSDEQSVATIYKTFDTQSELADFTLTQPAITTLSIYNNCASFSKSITGKMGIAYYNKPITQNTSFEIKFQTKIFGEGVWVVSNLGLLSVNREKYINLTFDYDGYYNYYYVTLTKRDGSTVELYSQNISLPQTSVWYDFKLTGNLKTKKIYGEVLLNNTKISYGIVDFPTMTEPCYIPFLGDFEGDGIGDGHYYQTGTLLQVDNFKYFLFANIDYTLGGEQTKETENTWVDLYTTDVSSKPYQILMALKKFVFINEEKDVFTWDGATTVALPGNKRAKFGLWHKNRLWLFNFPELNEGSMLWYSNINKFMDTADWQTNSVDNKEYIARDDGFEITGVGIMSDSIAIFKENAIYLLYGDIPNIYIKKLNIDVGCLASRSIADWENGVFFLSKIGIHFIRGTVAETPVIFTVDNIQSDNLATKIISIFNNLNQDYLKYAISAGWNDRYYITVPTYGSIVNTVILTLDYKAGWWSYWIPEEPITSMYVEPVSNIFYLGTTQGKLKIQQKEGLTTPNHYETGFMDLKIPNVRKRLRQLEVLFTGEMNLSVKNELEQINQWTLSNGNVLSKKKIPLLMQGKWFKLNFDNLTKNLHSVTLYYDYLRT